MNRLLAGLLGMALVWGGVGEASAVPIILNLADIVGGGDGTGTGGDQGIDPGSGVVTTSHAAGLSGVTANSYEGAASNPFVDGVFIPDGGPGGSPSIQVSSTDLAVSGISDASPVASWDYIWNGLNLQTGGAPTTTLIGMHANKGITFDLVAIEAANPGFEAASFSTLAAMTTNGSGSASFYLALDGVIMQSITLTGAGTTQAFSTAIGPSSRFLTLITSSNGPFNNDHSIFGDPQLTLASAAIPEPSALTLLTAGCFCLLANGYLRKRKAA